MNETYQFGSFIKSYKKRMILQEDVMRPHTLVIIRKQVLVVDVTFVFVTNVKEQIVIRFRKIQNEEQAHLLSS